MNKQIFSYNSNTWLEAQKKYILLKERRKINFASKITHEYISIKGEIVEIFKFLGGLLKISHRLNII